VALGESPRGARQISLDHFRRICTFHCDYQYFVVRTTNRVLRIADAIEIRGPGFSRSYIEIIDDWLGERGDAPIVLATIHMGSYLRGLLKLVQLSPRDRGISIIKQREWTRREALAYRHFERMGIDVDVIRLSDRPGVRARARLRSGNTLVVLFDSPPSFGARRSVTVSFFGRNASFPAGAALLAIVGRAVILPAVSYADADGRDVVRIETPIPADVLPGEDLHQATVRLTQDLAKLAEQWIRRTPSEWLLWQTLPELWASAHPESPRRRASREPLQG
jgi:lauroyl/myristoyl acyltransferase